MAGNRQSAGSTAHPRGGPADETGKSGVKHHYDATKGVSATEEASWGHSKAGARRRRPASAGSVRSRRSGGAGVAGLEISGSNRPGLSGRQQAALRRAEALLARESSKGRIRQPTLTRTTRRVADTPGPSQTASVPHLKAVPAHTKPALRRGSGTRARPQSAHPSSRPSAASQSVATGRHRATASRGGSVAEHRDSEASRREFTMASRELSTHRSMGSTRSVGNLLPSSAQQWAQRTRGDETGRSSRRSGLDTWRSGRDSPARDADADSVPSLGTARETRGQPTSQEMPPEFEYGKPFDGTTTAAVTFTGQMPPDVTGGALKNRYTVHADPTAKFYGETTAAEAFKVNPGALKKPAARVRPEPVTNKVPFNYKTTSQVSYTDLPYERTQPIKPRTNMTRFGEKLDATTTNAGVYVYSREAYKVAARDRKERQRATRRPSGARATVVAPWAAGEKLNWAAATESKAVFTEDEWRWKPQVRAACKPPRPEVVDRPFVAVPVSHIDFAAPQGASAGRPGSATAAARKAADELAREHARQAAIDKAESPIKMDLHSRGEFETTNASFAFSPEVARQSNDMKMQRPRSSIGARHEVRGTTDYETESKRAFVATKIRPSAAPQKPKYVKSNVPFLARTTASCDFVAPKDFEKPKPIKPLASSGGTLPAGPNRKFYADTTAAAEFSVKNIVDDKGAMMVVAPVEKPEDNLRSSPHKFDGRTTAKLAFAGASPPTVKSTAPPRESSKALVPPLETRDFATEKQLSMTGEISRVSLQYRKKRRAERAAASAAKQAHDSKQATQRNARI